PLRPSHAGSPAGSSRKGRHTLEHVPLPPHRERSVVWPTSKHVILILGGAIIRQFMNHRFRLPLELPPNPPCRCLPCRIHRDPDETEPSIQLLGVRLGSPPIRSGGLSSSPCIVEANRVVDRISSYPRPGSNPVSKVCWVVTHL